MAFYRRRRYNYSRRRWRGYGMAGRGARRRFYVGGQKFGVRLTMPFLIGVALGFSNLDDIVPAPIKILVAAAPIRGIGVFKGLAQGMLVGDVAQKLTGFTLPTPGINSSGGIMWG